MIGGAALEYLFAEQGALFAVLDGASVPDLPQVLYERQPEHSCLYRGKIEPDLAQTAPYLVRLEAQSGFAQWVLAEGWGRHWGIFASADADLPSLRHHFRKFLMVKNQEGKSLYFRYYDPRVMRVFLPTCNETDLEVLFGPVDRYFVEGEKPETLMEYSRADGKLVQKAVTLRPVSA